MIIIITIAIINNIIWDGNEYTSKKISINKASGNYFAVLLSVGVGKFLRNFDAL